MSVVETIAFWLVTDTGELLAVPERDSCDRLTALTDAKILVPRQPPAVRSAELVDIDRRAKQASVGC
jgi:hypothetical protein